MDFSAPAVKTFWSSLDGVIERNRIQKNLIFEVDAKPWADDAVETSQLHFCSVNLRWHNFQIFEIPFEMLIQLCVHPMSSTKSKKWEKASPQRTSRPKSKKKRPQKITSKRQKFIKPEIKTLDLIPLCLLMKDIKRPELFQYKSFAQFLQMSPECQLLLFLRCHIFAVCSMGHRNQSERRVFCRRVFTGITALTAVLDGIKESCPHEGNFEISTYP